MRSSTNVTAGAKTRASAILHGVWILVFAVPFAGLAQLIPTAALAGLLIVIGCQLVKRAHIETALRTGDIAVYTVTVAGSGVPESAGGRADRAGPGGRR